MKQLFGHSSIHLSVLESLRVKGFSVNSLVVLKPANGFDPKACQSHQRSPNKYYSLTRLSDKALLKSLFRELVRMGVLNVRVCECVRESEREGPFLFFLCCSVARILSVCPWFHVPQKNNFQILSGTRSIALDPETDK